MKKLLLVLAILVLTASPAHAWHFEEETYRGTWYLINGKVLRSQDLTFTEPAPGVKALTKDVAGTATRYEYYTDGNYYCAYNDGWSYYICGANDGSNFFCKYYPDGSIDCTPEVRG